MTDYLDTRDGAAHGEGGSLGGNLGNLDDRWPASGDPTGDPGVDLIVAQLSKVPQLPAAEQTQAYTELHDSLLAELDAAPQGD